MPERQSGEPLNDYIARFARNRRERKKFPELRQRLAVAYSEARRGPKKRARSESDE